MTEGRIFKSDKLKLDVYVPLDTCSCMWDGYMNRVFEVMTPYINLINFNTKSVNSDEAKSKNIYGNCVLIEDKHKLSSSCALKKRLPELLKEKGLL